MTPHLKIEVKSIKIGAKEKHQIIAWVRDENKKKIWTLNGITGGQSRSLSLSLSCCQLFKKFSEKCFHVAAVAQKENSGLKIRSFDKVNL